MYEITRACQKGDLKKCSCKDHQERIVAKSNANQQLSPNFEWAGCTDNVLFGHRLSKRFVDSKEYHGSLTKPLKLSPNRQENIYLNKEYKLMNLHNNEVGRRVRLCLMAATSIPNMLLWTSNFTQMIRKKILKFPLATYHASRKRKSLLKRGVSSKTEGLPKIPLRNFHYKCRKKI